MELFTRYKKVRMPNLRLGDSDVDTLTRYLEAQKVAALAELGLEP